MVVEAGGEKEHSHCDGGQPWCHGLGLGVGKGGGPVKLPIQDYGLVNLFYKHQKRDHYEVPSWDSWGTCINKGLQTDPFCRSWLPSTLCTVWRAHGIIWGQDGGPFLHRLTVLWNSMDISETWPPLCWNKYFRSQTLFPFGLYLLWVSKTGY